jgi:DNA (cytosine-5)-methyltransferase 1
MLNLRRFIGRNIRVAVKHLAGEKARVYLQNPRDLRGAGFLANTKIRISQSPGKITIVPDENGSNSVMDTARGELVELKNKATKASLGNVDYVTVTYRTGKIVITLHSDDIARIKREATLLNRVQKGEPIRKASFYSGTGLLSLRLKQGLAKQGIESSITFANEMNPLAMDMNLATNPMWQDASDDAHVVVDTINAIDISQLKQVDLAEAGYPCVGQSLLCDEEKRDLKHPDCGTLFVKLLHCLYAMNPAVIVIENTPRFEKSETLRIMQRELPGYRFETRVFNGHDFGELESRKRVAVIAVSAGLPEVAIDRLVPNACAPKVINDILDPIADNSPLWREMAHVKARDNNKNVGYRNCLYTGEESTMTTLTASYASPKAGTPMISHPTNPLLQRQLTPNEHANVRQLPPEMQAMIGDIVDGTHPLVVKTGSKAAAHRLLGNSVSTYIWTQVGEHLGRYLRECAKTTTLSKAYPIAV